MADALNNDRIYYYATNVVATEPIMPTNPLLKAKNCIITPHIAWAPKESRQRLIFFHYSEFSKFHIFKCYQAAHRLCSFCLFLILSLETEFLAISLNFSIFLWIDSFLSVFFSDSDRACLKALFITFIS